MKIAKEVKMVLNKLIENHFEAYIVGGAVRDYLLGIQPSDYDITTSATPDEIISIFKDFHIIDQGLKHGTVMVIINRKPIEITTYRIDDEYLDNRHPSRVSFTRNLREDLARRDFTINALAYYDEIIDYFDGIKDLHNKLIRSVGDPNKRFAEDSLRILRAIRFACQLDFSIEENTKNALFINKNLLKNISIERIVIEFNKMLMTQSIQMLPFYDIIHVFIPEIERDLFINNINIICHSQKDLIIRLALFFNNVNNYHLILERLKYPINTQKAIIVILKNKNILINNDKIAFKKLLKNIKYEDLLNIIMFKQALGEEIEYDKLELAKNECHQIKDLDINGYDLLKVGIPNKARGILLKHILDLVIEEKIDNNKELIISYINHNWIKNDKF